MLFVLSRSSRHGGMTLHTVWTREIVTPCNSDPSDLASHSFIYLGTCICQSWLIPSKLHLYDFALLHTWTPPTSSRSEKCGSHSKNFSPTPNTSYTTGLATQELKMPQHHQRLGSTCTSCLCGMRVTLREKRMVQCTYMWLWGYWELCIRIVVLTIGTGIGIGITIWQSRATMCQPEADTHIMRVRRMHTRTPHA